MQRDVFEEEAADVLGRLLVPVQKVGSVWHSG